MTKPPAAFEALTFDCYGTLIDWESGIWDALQPLLLGHPGEAPLRDEALVAYAQHEVRRQRETPDLRYEQILERVHASLASEWGLESTPALDAAFGASLPHWPAFPDTADALRRLARRFKLVVLSNVSRHGFAASQRKLGVAFDAVYTAETIGSWKPDAANFEYMLTHLERDLGIAPDGILHTAQSLFHDIGPAKALGLATAWIDRQRLSQGGSWGATASLDERPEPDHVFFSLAELADAVEGGA